MIVRLGLRLIGGPAVLGGSGSVERFRYRVPGTKRAHAAASACGLADDVKVRHGVAIHIESAMLGIRGDAVHSDVHGPRAGKKIYIDVLLCCVIYVF